MGYALSYNKSEIQFCKDFFFNNDFFIVLSLVAFFSLFFKALMLFLPPQICLDMWRKLNGKSVYLFLQRNTDFH